MTPIQLTISNNMLNISINVADLLSTGSINISLNNNQVDQQVIKIPVANAEVINDITNVTIRKPIKKTKKRPNLIIEDDDDNEQQEKEKN